MNVKLHRVNEAFHMEAINEQGNATFMDGSPDIGGSNLAFRPMQMLLAALGGCSTIDVIHLLKKQRQNVANIEVDINADREADKIPSLFTNIHIHYTVYGEAKPEKVEKAIQMSMDKLCSVKQILDKTANITWSFEMING